MSWAIFILYISAVMHHVAAEKGDTFTAVMTGAGLPPNSGYNPPTGKARSWAAKTTVHMVMTDNGITSNQTLKITYEVDFPSEKFVWQEVGLANTKLLTGTGNPLFFSLVNFTEPTFFVNGNYSFGELPSSLVDAGLCPDAVANAFCTNLTAITDNSNSTYGMTIIDEANKIAVGGPITFLPILLYGNGSNETAGTVSELQSEQIYVATLDDTAVGFPDGYTSGYKAGKGNGVSLIQYLEPNTTFLWEIDSENVSHPLKVELRYFVDLGYQPLVLDLHPDPPFPKPPHRAPEVATFNGNFTLQSLVGNLSALGVNWADVNFNNTPNMFMLNLVERDNTTISGFIYNANEAPPPLPVIKGGVGVAQGPTNSVASLVAAWIVFFFMVFNIVYFSSAVRNAKMAARDEELRKPLLAARAAEEDNDANGNVAAH